MKLHPITRTSSVVLRKAALSAAALGCLVSLQAMTPALAGLPIGNNPLYLVSSKANVLVILDNSNSMDEDATGAAVGSNASNSKSEIARGVVRNLTSDYLGRINMGLMAYRQNATSAWFLQNSPYDVSYDPANYNPGWAGARESATNKKFRLANPSAPGKFLYYNVGLPFYSSKNEGNAFCYSRTAHAFNNGENPSSGPWDTYRCFRTMTGTSDTVPATNGAEAGLGFSTYVGQYTFSPTDSDFAQGILDFGSHMSWSFVSQAWYANASPGRGFLHVPIGDLNAAKATALTSKLKCNVPNVGAPCSNTGIQNAGLTPIEGTLQTARDYFGGSWNKSDEGYTAGCYPLPTSCGKDFVILLTDGLPSTDRNGALVANPANALAAAAAAAADLKARGIETYVIGFALPFGTNPNSLDAVAAAGGTVVAYSAADTTTLQAAFDQIFNDILKKTAASGSAAQNSTSINAGSRVYQSRFSSTDWSGEIRAVEPSTTGTLTDIWTTDTPGRIAAPADRKVFTYKPGTGGMEFKTLTDFTTTQQAALTTGACGGALNTTALCGQARIDWLRGDRTYEESVGPLRKRSKVLGDAISSSPYYAADNKTLFIGSNDGMLHALDSVTGNELFAYLPNSVIPNIAQLTSPDYVHRYYVDGEIAVSEQATTPGSKNVLVATLGRGGNSMFALDVTDPASFDATKVLWEFTDPDLGIMVGKPMIAKLNNGTMAVIVGNGFNSASDRAFLFIINLQTGALISKIDTKAGSGSSPNAMAQPTGWDLEGNGTVDLIFSGDRLGNVWKWDLRSASPASWGPAFGTLAAPAPLFVATDSSNTRRQPVMGGIGLGLNGRKGDANFGKLFVFVGTGQYLVTADVTDKSVQTWYGLVDSTTAITGRAQLKARTIAAESTVSGSLVRSFSKASTGDMTGKRGWYIDWIPTSGTPAGERIIGESKFLGNVVYVTSIIPSTDVCKPGGDGFLNAVDPFSGASLSASYFDVKNDGSFASFLSGGQNQVIGSIQPKNNLPSDAILIGNRLITSGTSGGLESTGANNSIRTGRIAWREIVRP